jgi:hypothetical protein
MSVRGTTAILQNRVANCGWFGAMAMGMVIADSLQVAGAMLRIEDCEVVDTGLAADGTATQGAAAGVIASAQACQVVGNHIGYTLADAPLKPDKEHRALAISGPLLFMGGSGFFGMRSSALIEGNQFRGPGLSALVELLASTVGQGVQFKFERATFSNNTCDHWSTKAAQNAATVQLRAAYVIASGNHIKAPLGMTAIAAGSAKGTLMGNVATGPYAAPQTLPQPVNNFNTVLP